MTIIKWRAMLLLLTGLAGCGASPGDFTVEDAVIRANPVPGRPAAGYFTIANHGGDDRLRSVEVEGAAQGMIHQSRIDATGVMRMAKVEALPIAAGATLVFAPGGYHLMIFGLDPGLETATIHFHFDHAPTISIVAPVTPPG